MRTETLTQRQSRSFLSCSCRKHGKRGKHACLRCNAPHTRETCLNTPRKQAATHLLHRCLFGSKCASAKPRTQTRNLNGKTRMGAIRLDRVHLLAVQGVGCRQQQSRHRAGLSPLHPLPTLSPPPAQSRAREATRQLKAEQLAKADELIKADQQSSRPKQMSSSKQSSSVRDCSKPVDCKERRDYLNI